MLKHAGLAIQANQAGCVAFINDVGIVLVSFDDVFNGGEALVPRQAIDGVYVQWRPFTEGGGNGICLDRGGKHVHTGLLEEFVFISSSGS